MAERVPDYDELKLRLEKEASGSYTVLAFAPDGRTGRGSFAPPVTDDELDNFVRAVGLVRRTRRSSSTRMEEVESFGSKLFAALVKDQVEEVYQAARAAAEERGHGLRITIQLSGAPELMRLPWEFLYRRPRFLSQSIRTPLVRSLDLETAGRPQKVELPLRILGMVSGPAGYPELDADDERLKLEQALRQLRSNGLVDLQWLESATLGELGRRITEPDDIHVLHYIGHGAYDEATESGILVLETPQGRADDVSGRELGGMLQDEDSLRLVVLNSCEGARTSRIDPFSGVATSLVEFDIPAVIAMQFEITDEAAIAFSDSLYTQLAHGLPVDAALAPARRAIGAQKKAEFGTPVLFLRAADARLFDVEHLPAYVPVPTGAPEARPPLDQPAPETDEHAAPTLGGQGTRLLLGGLAVAALAGLLGGLIGKLIKADDPVAAVVASKVLRGAEVWALVAAAAATWLAVAPGVRGSAVRNAFVGLWVGALAGAIGGLIAGPAIIHREDRPDWLSAGFVKPLPLISLVVTGALIGAMAGRLWPRRWTGAGILAGLAGGALAHLVAQSDLAAGPLNALQGAVVVGLSLAALLALDAWSASAGARREPSTPSG